jgi:hypothetical protein
MIRRVAVCLIACFVFSTVLVVAEDWVPQVLKYFPGKWEHKDADGQPTGTSDWKLVSGGSVFAGPGKLTDGTEIFEVAAWDPLDKKWVHTAYDADGGRTCEKYDRFENDTYYGTHIYVDPKGETITAKCHVKVIDKDHFQFTLEKDGKTKVGHSYRIR